MTDFKRCLNQAMKEAGFILDERQLERFKLYRDELKRWNRRINLTSVADDCGIIYKHFVDSVLPIVCGLILPRSRLADVGTGPGFPGLCLKLIEPTLKVTLIDSSHKKTAFLKCLVAMMGLEETEVVRARAEELIRKPEYSGRFDYVTARYVAELRKLVRYCLPLLKPGGRLIAYKGKNVRGELDKALEPIQWLGAQVIDVVRFERPLKYRLHRSFVVIEKRKDGQDIDSFIG
ncbi:16S rRNA (guanine(527)-N(7))-methyltransferase RsmG [Candidatus Poribacteria bacterium]|nr:16S rRNA (guanine(527)-N(7))-methyltransferase RsmG [Candidatus Poribacteria bacterium]